MKVLWAILCERAVVDQETNNISLFNVIEEVTIPAQPPMFLTDANAKNVLPTAFELIVLWGRSNSDVPERGLGRVSILIPDATPKITQEHDIDLSVFLRLRSKLRLPGLPVGGEGTYLFKIDGKLTGGEWTEMFELPLRVVFQPQEAG